MADPTVSFVNDIVPIFFGWRSQMIWRLDLAKYEDVKMNADIIYQQISEKLMPPPPFPSFSTDQIRIFKKWIDEGHPR